jgi:hypothetical protein
VVCSFHHKKAKYGFHASEMLVFKERRINSTEVAYFFSKLQYYTEL